MFSCGSIPPGAIEGLGADRHAGGVEASPFLALPGLEHPVEPLLHELPVGTRGALPKVELRRGEARIGRECIGHDRDAIAVGHAVGLREDQTRARAASAPAA